MRGRYRSENGVVRLAQVPPTGVIASIVIPEDYGDAFVVWSATLEVVLVAGNGQMNFGLRIGGVGQPSGLAVYSLHFSAPGSRASVFGGGLGVLNAGTVVDFFGRMVSADQVDLIARGFVLGVL